MDSTKAAHCRTPGDIDAVSFAEITDLAFQLLMPKRRRRGIARTTRQLVDAAVAILEQRQPMTLRGLHYQLVVAGFYPNDRNSYQKLSRAMVWAREAGEVDWDWLTDNIRETLKPSSWSGLQDFGDTIRGAYRKAFWPRMPHYVCVFCEKDAMAAAIEPETSKYDVALHVVRGYVSASYAHSIAEQWKRIEKPVFAYYLGDWDASGLDLERNLRESLAKYSGRIDSGDGISELWAELSAEQQRHIIGADDDVHLVWKRLALNADDFDEFELAPMLAKKTDSRYRKFVKEHGHDCAELDAIPIDVLRERVGRAIHDHVDVDEWNRLCAVEEAEQETIDKFVDGLAGAKGAD